ncbi:MoaD/ThiS family protein [Salinimonas marina]|uniref:Molybdopterin synthase sulfur carrier subunit n=1 Tax=Salinimonas marina TaxID=2785918 RepID=A0A7S9HDZ2_9ALTE|nr:MoaD/ThiS family protein [Salinimonas marina]QPG06771.1 MoaD/ThiS family protein [Salinimonas marina]
MITIKTFAQVRELSGCAETTALWQPDMTVSSLMTQLVNQDPAWSQAFSGKVLTAVNQTICSTGQPLNDNDEVAFFPPVTGG